MSSQCSHTCRTSRTPHLHEPREHQQYELILLSTCALRTTVRSLWPNGRTVLTYRYGAQAVHVGWERTSAIDTENKFMLNGLRWGSQNDSLPVKVVREVTTVLALHVAARGHLRRDSQNRGASDTGLFSDPAVRRDPMRGFSEQKIEQRRSEFARQLARDTRGAHRNKERGARRDGEDRHQQAQSQELEDEVAKNDQFHFAKQREIRDEDVRRA